MGTVAARVIPASVTWQEKERLLNLIADEGARDPTVRALALAIVMRAGARAPAEMLQALLDAIPELVEYTPDGGYEDVFGSVLGSLAPRQGNPVSRITGRPRGSGDCEDTSTVFAGLARSLGLDARVTWVLQPDAPQDHVAVVACAVGVAAFGPGGCGWVETTIPGAQVGEDPYTAVLKHGRGERVMGRKAGNIPDLSAAQWAPDAMTGADYGYEPSATPRGTPLNACPDGYRYNEASNSCERLPPADAHACETGRMWNEATRACEPVTVHACPGAQRWDPLNSACVDPPAQGGDSKVGIWVGLGLLVAVGGLFYYTVRR